MDRQQIGLKLALDQLGLSPRLTTFSERLILQKAVYLAQAAGVQLGYHYNWYLRGPYSPSLTKDAFAVADETDRNADYLQGWKLDDTSKKRLVDMKPLIEQKQKDADEFPRQMELLASVHFLLINQRAKENSAELKTVLKRYGKDFTEKQIKQAIEELNAHGLGPAPQAQ